MSQKAIPVIVGPTASGKSDFALKIAKLTSGEIVNADSLQVYKDIQILSARPNKEEEQNIPHHLYGYIDAYSTCSVAKWLQDVQEKLLEIKQPIFVGGTGLYIKALVEGISPMPDVDDETRELVRNMPIEEVQSKVIECNAIDPQRLRRALEIQLSTGKPISYFQNQPKQKITNREFKIFFLNPKREELYANCNKRFEKMLNQGAIDEVKHLTNINATGGVLKAIGVLQISKWLNGEISKKEMIEKSTQETRNYAKRQVTWFKNQFKNSVVFEPKEIDQIIETFFA